MSMWLVLRFANSSKNVITLLEPSFSYISFIRSSNDISLENTCLLLCPSVNYMTTPSKNTHQRSIYISLLFFFLYISFLSIHLYIYFSSIMLSFCPYISIYISSNIGIFLSINSSFFTVLSSFLSFYNFSIYLSIHLSIYTFWSNSWHILRGEF